MKQLHSVPKQRILTAALLLALATPVAAQDAATDSKDATAPTTDATTAEAAKKAEAAKAEAATLDTVVVTGIRGSLTSSMDIKREARASSTASSPRTSASSPTPTWPNRCSASAACRSTARHRRRLEGHGARRRPGLQPGAAQRPADAGVGHRTTPAPPIRAPSISPTWRPNRSPRSRSTRPAARQHAHRRHRRDHQHQDRASAGGPGMHRQRRRQGRVRHVERQPARTRCRAVTSPPEISGIFSNTFADGTFGVALSGSYQERDLGYSQAAVAQRLARRSAATRTTGARSRSAARPARKTSPTARIRPTSTRCRRT